MEMRVSCGTCAPALTPARLPLSPSPVNLMGTGRHSSSSLSSHASSEAGNVVMLGDSSMGEAPEDLYHHMQVSAPSQESGPGYCPWRTHLSAGWSGLRVDVPAQLSSCSMLNTQSSSNTAFPPRPGRSSQAALPKKETQLQCWPLPQISWETPSAPLPSCLAFPWAPPPESNSPASRVVRATFSAGCY